jgi:N-methylhydantoinase B/oxoprolinase/acetone carboxylase alpha subunit
VFRNSKAISDLETRVAALSLAVAEIRTSLDRSTNEQLFKIIGDLQQDIEATRISLRSLHGKVAIQKRLEPGNGRAAADIPGDEEFQQMLALQRSFNGGSN